MRDPIEQVHSTFCKMVLGVSKKAVTCNKACRAGRSSPAAIEVIKTNVRIRAKQVNEPSIKKAKEELAKKDKAYLV